MNKIWIFLVLVSFPLQAAEAGEADVVAVTVKKASGGVYDFDVTVSHDDEGWSHYADKWEVLGTDGTLYGTRTLLHPHVGEQPFTRSLSGVVIPKGISEVTIRAHDSVHKFGGRSVTKPLP